MSAYIVEQETINRAITRLDAPEFGYIKDKLKSIRLGGDLQELGRAMMNLNIDAVNQRYGENTEPQEVPYCFSPQPVTKVQAYKSLTCWLYQSAEGNVPNKRLYQIMENYRTYLASEIINRLPEYDTAEWG